uniref:Odorant receptor n=1 Tax=Locusta migratoria TaxID=7004 RepID=A0A0M4IUD6_LOCMI|nr:odorant receptor 31 [Locusta migratoria]
MCVRVPWRDSALWANARLLSVAGVWPPPSSGGWYLLYTCWLFGSQLFMVAGQLAGLWRFRGDLDKLTLDVCLTVTVVMGVIKAGAIVARRRRFFGIVRRLDAATAAQLLAGDPEEAAVVASAASLARTITVWAPVLGSLSPVVWGLAPLLLRLLGNAPRPRELPVVCWYGGWDAASPYYELLYLVQFVTIQGGYLVVMGSDLFFVSLMIHAAAQLRILNMRLVKIARNEVENDKTFGGMKCVPGYRNSNLKIIDKEWTSSATKTQDLTDETSSYDELRSWVEQHKDVIRLVQQLEQLLNVIILFQFLGGTIIICVTLYQSSAKTGEVTTLFKLQLYLGTMLSEIFMYCWYADGIVQQSARLATSAYSCGWPDAPQPFRRSLLIIMRRCQRPLSLTAGKFYTISRATFVRLVNASYSYYALLRQMNDH